MKYKCLNCGKQIDETEYEEEKAHWDDLGEYEAADDFVNSGLCVTCFRG